MLAFPPARALLTDRGVVASACGLAIMSDFAEPDLKILIVELA
jgi:hypothetical protein